MHVDPIKPTLEALGYERLKLTCDDLLSILALNVNLRHYIKVTLTDRTSQGGEGGGGTTVAVEEDVERGTVTWQAGVYTRPRLCLT